MLNKIVRKTMINNMQLNVLKFEHLAYGKNEMLKQLSKYLSDTYTQIETKKQVKDLGITLDTNLTYDHHIQN